MLHIVATKGDTKMETEIRINAVTGLPEFVYVLPHDNPSIVSFKTVESAIVYARAFTDGVTAARNMLAITSQWHVTPEISKAIRDGK
jgi:hypothetical protein